MMGIRDFEYESKRNTTQPIRKQRIHFILPGGGVNGAFQAGFLYRLFKDCGKYIEVERIDGISVGCLNGIAMILEDPELIKTIWYSIENRESIFDSHTNSKDVFRKGSLYNSHGLRTIIENYTPFVRKNLLERFNCVVHNKDTGEHEYVNGGHCSIWEYVIASASPPVISPACKIGEGRYSDGGVDIVYPIEYVRFPDTTYDTAYDAPNVMNLIVGYYEEKRYYLFKLYKKFKKSIEENMNVTRDHVDKGHIHIVYNRCRYNIIDFKPDVIDIAFKQGEECAVSFYLQHIIQ